jgi:hypothetical protein
VRTGPTGFFRSATGVQGRSGHDPVSPFFFRAAGEIPPTTFLMPAPHGEFSVLAEVRPDPEHGRTGHTLRQLVFRRPDGAVECIPFSPGWSAEHLKTAMRARNVAAEQLIEVYLGDGEEPDSFEVRRLLTDALGNFSVRAWYGDADERVERHTELRLGISRRYIRAIAKAAFHYFLWASVTCHGDETEFGALRRLIRYDEGRWQDFVELTSGQFIPHLTRGMRPLRSSHFYFSEVNYERAFGHVQFFVGPDVVPPPSTVRFGQSPARLHGRQLTAHWVQYFPQRTDGFDGEVGEIDVSARRIVLPPQTF